MFSSRVTRQADEREIPPEIEDQALAGVTSNNEWQPYIQEFDGTVLYSARTSLYGLPSDSGAESDIWNALQVFAVPDLVNSLWFRSISVSPLLA